MPSALSAALVSSGFAPMQGEFHVKSPKTCVFGAKKVVITDEVGRAYEAAHQDAREKVRVAVKLIDLFSLAEKGLSN